MENVSSPAPASAPPIANKTSGFGAFFQIIALLLAVPAVAWGVFIGWSTAFPPKCGDWSGFTPLGVLECWVVDLPIGVLILVIGLLVKKGSPRLRKICIGTSCVVLALPVIASILLQSWHCP